MGAARHERHSTRRVAALVAQHAAARAHVGAALVAQHAAARAHVGAARDTSTALDHAEPMRPSRNTARLVPTWAPRSTAGLDAPVEQHAAACAHVGAARDVSAALNHAKPIHPSRNTPWLVSTGALRSTAELNALEPT